MTRVDRPTRADIPDLMRVERGEGFAELVGRWSAERHAAEMAVPGARYLAARDDAGAIEGSALLQGLDDPREADLTLTRTAPSGRARDR